jgi:hypothetical protein
MRFIGGPRGPPTFTGMTALLARTGSLLPSASGLLLALLTSALGGCRVTTDLADVTAYGGARAASDQARGPSSTGGGKKASGDDADGAGGVDGQGSRSEGGASPEPSEAGGTAGNHGTDVDCWEPTVTNYCHHFECPPAAQPPAWPTEEEMLEHFQAIGLCDEHTVVREIDVCGGSMLSYVAGTTSEGYLIISGTLGATFQSRDTPFGPCDQTSYYSGIERDEWYAMCSIESRCIACGPSSPSFPYPACEVPPAAED